MGYYQVWGWKSYYFFKFLIENKININIRDKDGNTPLGIVIISNNEELVDYLLKNNADISNINGQNKDICRTCFRQHWW